MKDLAGSISSERVNRREAAGPKGEGRDSPSTFSAYPEYKESGVEWLGEVPAHWQVKRMRFVAILNPSKSEVRHLPGTREVSFIPMEAVGEEGSLDLSQTRPLGDVIDGYTYLSEGDVTFAKITPCFENGKGAIMRGLHGGVGFGTTELTVARPDTSQVTGDYLYRVISSRSFRELGESHMYGAGGQKRVPDDFLRNFELAWPPVPEQATIAAFLDHETARIDALVEEQQRLIALLKEKRQAVISHAVTKGLAPGVPMKDSGVEWLGEVPAHWQIKRIKHVVRDLEQGWSPQCENITVQDAHEWGVLKVGCVNNGRFNESENKRLPEGIEPKPELAIRSGDVLISRANTRDLVGSCAVPTNDHPNLMMSDKLFRLRLKRDLADPRYLSFFMNSSNARELIEVEATGASSSMLNIGQGTILELTFPCPPLEEQVAIKGTIVNETWQLLSLAEQALEIKKRLEERRSALISAAVTGKIDVRGWTPSAEGAPAQQETTRMEAV